MISLLLVGVAWAREPTFPSRPDGVRSHVTDEVGVLTSQARREIDRIAHLLQAEHQVPTLVIILGSLASHDARTFTVEQYAHLLYERWQLGSASDNRAMLLVVSLGDLRLRLELGSAWSLDDREQAQLVVERQVLPRFQQQRYGEGLVDGLEGLRGLIRGERLATYQLPGYAPHLLVCLVLLGLLVMVSLLRSGTGGWGYGLLVFLGGVLAYLFSVSSTSRGPGAGPPGLPGGTGTWRRGPP